MRRLAAFAPAVAVLSLGGCSFLAFDDSAPAKSHGVVISGSAELPYEVFGTGADTVILLAGGPAFPSASLRGVAARIGRHHTAILSDGRGRGASRSRGQDGSRPGPAQDVRDLEAVVEHFQLSRFSLVAHHYGALVATGYLLRHPGRVTRLLLLGPIMPRSGYNFDLALLGRDTTPYRRAAELYASDVARRPKAFCEVSWGWMLAPAPELDPAVVRDLAPRICAAPDSVLAKRGGFKQAVLGALGAWDYRDSIAAIPMPVLVLQGDRNKVLNHSAANWAYRAPRGTLLLLRGSPFFPWITDPVRTGLALDAFLAGREPDGARRPERGEVISPDDSLGQDQATKFPSVP